MKKLKYGIIAGLLLLLTKAHAQDKYNLIENFDVSNTSYQKIGRGTCNIANSVLTTKDAYLTFGENTWANYEIEFKARVPESAEQVQICAGFRAANRDDRYILMLKGGIQKQLYLAVWVIWAVMIFWLCANWIFSPRQANGIILRSRLPVTGSRVFLNNEASPRIDVADKLSNLAPAGKITLGGSWINNEFDDLSIFLN